ncbi:hypothetical protein LHA31_06335 [Carnobacterium viridans]|uniref:Uncharacterized protein n=1 Tax=Carnobacterium viridans TaxID=174587 RepID=A0A1H1AAD0_9LACT|nr:hypothetical protein [Carnobacterium viridans]UDE94246.1 hypothetical protein LHA31_06335 [Carnobacterium viridans]SDQ36226.1 hypothetical protein SAMN04487752_1969 [Carnobacterium viridans]
MKKTLFYLTFIIVPALFIYFYNVYLVSIEGLLSKDPLAVTSFIRIVHILFPLVIAIVLIFLSLYSLKFSKFKSFYIVLTVYFIVFLALSILPLFSNILPLSTSVAAIYIMNDFPWYAGYYGGTLLFALVYNKINKPLLIK